MLKSLFYIFLMLLFSILNNVNAKLLPFNFMLIGQDKNDVVPCLPYDKNTLGIQYKPFVDYKIDTASDKLPLPFNAYWHTLDDILTKYVMNNDNKFDYDKEGIAHRKHIVVNRIRYIGNAHFLNLPILSMKESSILVIVSYSTTRPNITRMPRGRPQIMALIQNPLLPLCFERDGGQKV